MTKAEIVTSISEKTGIEKGDVLATVEALMEEIKGSLEKNDNVYLPGFGSCGVRRRAEKAGRNIATNTAIMAPAHAIPAVKPAKGVVEAVKSKGIVE